MNKIPVDLLKRFHQYKSESVVVGTYIDKNPLVRWLYWDRLKKMLDYGRKCGASKVLDLGCGEGVFLPSLSENFSQVYGVDIDIRAAQEVVSYYKLNNVQLFQTDLFDNSFDENYFDLVFAASVLEHFEERDKLFIEIMRLITPGGFLIFSSPMETWFYKLGRKIFGYKKPDDHYFSAYEIASTGRKYLNLVDNKYCPFNLPPFLAACCIYVFKKDFKKGN